MEAKYTRWKRESEINPDGSDWILVTNDYRIVADLRLNGNTGANVTIEEQEANAHLILAAPDLLVAAEHVIEAFDGVVFPVPEPQFSELRAAITKATNK